MIRSRYDSGYTLRRLKWMANGKAEHDYDVAVATIGYLGMGIGGQLKGETNPVRKLRGEERLTAQQAKEYRQRQSEYGWAMLKRGLKTLAGVS